MMSDFLPSEIKTPESKLSKDVIKVKIIDEVMENVIIMFVLGVLFYLNKLFSWDGWISWLLIGITIIIILIAFWSIFISPFLLYKNWRYHVDRSEERRVGKEGWCMEVGCSYCEYCVVVA